MTRVICTGRPGHGGIAQSIEKYFPTTMFVNRTAGWDLTNKLDYDKFISVAKDYNVFINHSQIEYGMQKKLLTDIAALWDSGHIISIGSILEFEEWQHIDVTTSKEKLDIRNQSLNLCSENIKTTHLITSGYERFGPEQDVKINPDKIVEIIKFILESDIDIPLIYVDKINDSRLNKWRSLNV